MQDVVVILPGILGSTLRKEGHDVWAPSGVALSKALFTLFSSIKKLQLSSDASADDGVAADRLIPDTHMIPGLWKIDGYSNLYRTIQRQFETKPGLNLFEFPYDWRRDNRVAAKRLAELAPEWLATWRNRSGSADARLILIAHSMGGLVARYFIEVLGGWQYTRSLISFGTPYRGAIDALDYIANGFRKRLGFLTLVDLSEMLRSLPSVYQLLPTYACCDPGGGRMVHVAEATGIPNLDIRKTASAREFHREIEDAVETNSKDESYIRNRYVLHPVAGIWQPTLQSARIADNKLIVSTEFPDHSIDGDGRVPRVSAIPADVAGDRRGIFVSARHASLQNDGAVMVQLEGILSAAEFDSEAFRAADRVRVALDIDDAFAPDEPVVCRIRTERHVSNLTANVIAADTGHTVAVQTFMSPGDRWTELQFAPLRAGVYRLVVSGPPIVTPVSDIFAVVEDGAA
jgi:hypothetical protein